MVYNKVPADEGSLSMYLRQMIGTDKKRIQTTFSSLIFVYAFRHRKVLTLVYLVQCIGCRLAVAHTLYTNIET